MKRKIILLNLLLITVISVVFANDKSATQNQQTYPNNIQKVLMDKIDNSRWKTSEGLNKLIPLPRGIGNAAVDYAKLKKLFKKEKGKSVKIDLKNTEGINVILAGTRKRKCSFVPAIYPPMTDFKPATPDVIVFQAYADAMTRKSRILERNNQFAEAEKLLISEIILGWHLTEDRPNLLTYILGISIQEQACKNYVKFLERDIKGAKARMVRKYADNLKLLLQKVRLKSRRILSSWLEFSSLAACEKTIRTDKEKIWQQEALLSVGVMQNGFPDASGKFIKNPLYQNIARKLLLQTAQSGRSQSIKQLAKWCLENMTEEKIMQIRKNSK